MTNFEQPSMPPFTSADQQRGNELERKKEVKRENRLKQIVEKNLEQLQSLFPEKAKDFEIVYEAIYERKSMFDDETRPISDRDLPAYGIFLRLKSDPSQKYQMIHLFRPDLDAKKSIFDAVSNKSFIDRIKEGVEKLNSEK